MSMKGYKSQLVHGGVVVKEVFQLKVLGELLREGLIKREQVSEIKQIWNEEGGSILKIVVNRGFMVKS